MTLASFLYRSLPFRHIGPALLFATALSVALAIACAGTEPDPIPQTGDPLAAPTPYEVPGDPLPSPTTETSIFDTISRQLGYALVPGTLPDGFELGAVDMLMFPSNPTGRQIYAESEASEFQLHISYPMRFPPTGGSLFEHAGFGLPEDALSEVAVGDGKGYVIRGGWDPQTLRLGFPSEAQWDYQKSLTVMVFVEMGDMEPVWVAVRAENSPELWITEAELVIIAGSLTKIP